MQVQLRTYSCFHLLLKQLPLSPFSLLFPLIRVDADSDTNIHFLPSMKMTLLPRRNTFASWNGSGASVTPTETCSISSDGVTFLPAMVDASCGTSATHHRQTTAQMFLNDLRIVTQSVRCIPQMARSVLSMKFARSIPRSVPDIWDICLQGILSILEFWALIIAVPAFLYLPGIVFVPLCGVFIALVRVLSWPLNKSPLVRTSRGLKDSTRVFPEETWMFIPGSATRYASFLLPNNNRHI